MNTIIREIKVLLLHYVLKHDIDLNILRRLVEKFPISLPNKFGIYRFILPPLRPRKTLSTRLRLCSDVASFPFVFTSGALRSRDFGPQASGNASLMK